MSKPFDPKEYLRNIVEQAVRDPIEVRRPQLNLKNVYSEDSVLCFLSDTHDGKITPTFNPEIFEYRIKEYFEYVKNLCVDLKVKNLHVALAGDIIDGNSIYPGQAFHIAMPAVKQYLHASKVISENLVTLLSTRLKNIKVYGLIGNHARIGKKGEEPFLNSWEYAMYHHMQAYFRKQNDINVDICEDWYKIIDINEFNVMLTHGDAIQGGALASIKNAAMKWAATMNEHWDVLVMGHFHNNYKFPVGNRMVYGNGTLVSDDEYSKRVIKEEHPPSQKILIFTKGQIQEIDYKF
jgi:hypothetical protein